MVKVDLSGALGFLDSAGPDYGAASLAHKALADGIWAGAEFTGWRQLPRRVQGEELKKIQLAAERIRDNSQVLVVVGIGGSYLGARAGIELIRPKNGPEVIFAGNGLSPDDLNDKIERLGDRDFSVNVVSKSGTTLEPAVAFRVFRGLLEKKYGTGAKKRIYATTDAAKGVLKTIADSEGYETFVVPDDVGGRYSVLSAVGLLPLAAAGCDVNTIVDAAAEAMYDLDQRSADNPAWQYAATRNALYAKGKTIELLASYEPSFRYMAEWWKQLFGESEGKNGVGIYPASVEYNADLHSMGQYIQEGPRTLMETVVSFERPLRDYEVPFSMGDADGLNYLAGRGLGDISRVAMEAVKAAHVTGGVPNIGISIPRRDEEGFAELVCFFETACAISGYMLGVNPFDQPGVEAYKKNMFRMLGKPGA
ncbi:MAG: glucose-6-phosphate isomerase [Oscillospiraceae bacterium]|nr:glucose-6-phosphate isomerase [Oscillospiraceae bacterium]